MNLQEAIYATGKRKTAVAKVWLIKEGSGNILLNRQPLSEYVKNPAVELVVRQPLMIVGAESSYDVWATAKGGGIVAQAGALRHGIAKALSQLSEEFKRMLRQAGFLTRDPRVKERKKYGRKRARRGFQYSKR